MKKISAFILSIFIAVASSYSQNDKTMKNLTSVVKEIQTITQKDAGKFWNIKYATPLLFVNPENRQTFVFEPEKEPYIVQLDNMVPVANTSSDWNGKKWAMMQIPLPKDAFEYEKFILHEMFHVLQPQLRFDSLYQMLCEHLDKEEGAILLRLELQALLKALEQSNNKDSMYKHITNALSFRNGRYALYSEAKEYENSIEINEGIAEYTALMMTQRYSPNKLNDKKLLNYFRNRITAFEQGGSFVRRFAYEAIPLYGYLIQMDVSDWHQKVTKETNLIDYFMQIIKGNVHEEWKTLAAPYNYKDIAKEEHARFAQRDAVKNAVTEKFFCANHVEIPLIKYTYSFGNFMVLDSIGEFHNHVVVIDSWGKVEASNGAILDKGNRKVLLSPVMKTENNIITGDGWELYLNDGWVMTEQQGWMEVQKSENH
jgi:hypothetical protein